MSNATGSPWHLPREMCLKSNALRDHICNWNNYYFNSVIKLIFQKQEMPISRGGGSRVQLLRLQQDWWMQREDGQTDHAVCPLGMPWLPRARSSPSVCSLLAFPGGTFILYNGPGGTWAKGSSLGCHSCCVPQAAGSTGRLRPGTSQGSSLCIRHWREVVMTSKLEPGRTEVKLHPEHCHEGQ